MAFAWNPILSVVSKGARALWPYIQEAVAQDVTVTEFIETIKLAGLPGARRQDILALFREATGAELLKSDIARWPKDVLFPIARVRESATQIVAPFSYTLRVRAVDNETGDEIEMLRQAHSDSLMGLDKVAAKFLAEAPTFEQYQEITLISAEVIDIQRSGALGTL